MTVAELVAALSAHPPGARVLVEGYERGWDDVQQIRPARVALGVYGQSWNGRHALLESDGDRRDAALESGRPIEEAHAVLVCGRRSSE